MDHSSKSIIPGHRQCMYISSIVYVIPTATYHLSCDLDNVALSWIKKDKLTRVSYLILRRLQVNISIILIFQMSFFTKYCSPIWPIWGRDRHSCIWSRIFVKSKVLPIQELIFYDRSLYLINMVYIPEGWKVRYIKARYLSKNHGKTGWPKI